MVVCRSKSVLTALVVALLLVGLPLPASGVVATAVGPVTTIYLDPAEPNGDNGWYSDPPEVRLVSDADGTAYHTWNGGAPASAPIVAGIPGLYIGEAPEGSSLLAAHTVDSFDSQGPTATVSVNVDTIWPTMPDPLEVVAGPGNVSLTWGPSVEAGSGLAGYVVYRNTVGGPFDPDEAVASVSGTGWVDPAPPVADLVYYSVSGVDNAGWESILTTAVAVTPDAATPTAPGDLQAWLNASNWVRVSWTPSVDAGSGLSHYEVYRSLDGGAMELVGTVGAGSEYYDDHDDQVLFATTVEYQVVAVDRVGLESLPAGPVDMATDLSAPPAPSNVSISPVYSGTYTPAQFDVTWTASSGTGAAIAATELFWGPVSGSPAQSADVSGGIHRVTASAPTSLLFFQLRTTDRAGNLSPITAPSAGRNIAADRLAGATRIQTALAASAASFASADTVVVVSSASFPDALCASSLAGSVGGPVLLAGPGVLPSETLAEIARLGAVNAYIVGGSGVVSLQTEASLDAALSGVVTRKAGADRYSTAAEVAREVSALAGGASPDLAFVVSGTGFADALSVAPAAYAGQAPVLYANSLGLPAVTSGVIAELDVARVLVVGGSGAVAAGVESVLPAGERVAGADRYATNRAFVDWIVADGILDLTSPVMATGRDYPDGLVSGPVGGSRGSALLLTSPTTAAQLGAWLAPERAILERVTAVGGTGAVSEAERIAVWSACSVP